MADTVRAGIVGTGFMGGVHARAIRSAGAEIVAVAGSDISRASALVTQFPGARPLGTFDELLDQDLDVVHVCTPNAAHHRMALAVLASGRHVVCEKPLATTVDAATELAEAAAGRIATVPFVYRFYPTVREARRRIAADPGGLWLLHGSYLQDWMGDRAATGWRADPAAGGVSRAFGDIGVHWCDLMEFVTGHRITALQARFANAFATRGPSDTPVTTEDGVVMTFETDRGAVGSLVVSQVSAGRKNRLHFSFDGPEATYVFDQERPESLWIGGRGENREIVRDPVAMPACRAPTPAGHPEGYEKTFENFVADTYAAIAGEPTDGLPTFDDGLRAAQITAAAVESSRTGAWTEVAT